MEQGDASTAMPAGAYTQSCTAAHQAHHDAARGLVIDGDVEVDLGEMQVRWSGKRAGGWDNRARRAGWQGEESGGSSAGRPRAQAVAASVAAGAAAGAFSCGNVRLRQCPTDSAAQRSGLEQWRRRRRWGAALAAGCRAGWEPDHSG